MAQTLRSPAQASRSANLRAWLLVAGATVAWQIAYNVIQPLADWLAYGLLGLAPGSHLGEAAASFLYDVPKILLLLSGMIFAITTGSWSSVCPFVRPACNGFPGGDLSKATVAHRATRPTASRA